MASRTDEYARSSVGGLGRLTLADFGVVDGKAWVAVEPRQTLVALASARIVQTVVAHSAAHATRVLIHGRVEVAGARVAIAVALCKGNRQH